MATPEPPLPPPPALRKSCSGSMSQTSIAGFFTRKSVPKKGIPSKPGVSSDPSLTPAPSSDGMLPEDHDENSSNENTAKKTNGVLCNGLPSPVTPLPRHVAVEANKTSPSRRAKKPISYAESDDDDVVSGNPRKRRKQTNDDAARDVPVESPPPLLASESSAFELPTVSTAETWRYDPEDSPSRELVKHVAPVRKPQVDAHGKVVKAKAHASKPEERYSWLANLQDADRNPVGHPSYDPRTVYIPPKAWAGFSPFETQYWKIKQKFMDTIVFFKKGKFYELYEHDATIGHQLFDLKLTDRVNMRMVGVPEMSLDHWANQFVAAGYKIARVDQQESALGKEMRERDGSSASQKSKVIERKLACVLTSGTLVDGGMLQDDMSTYCVAVKESEQDGLPAFGISYVDAATGQFFVTEFLDDIELTKFETFLAQIRPQELILEKSSLSVAATRVIKNNTMPTTLQNHLKPGKEFWAAETAARELDAGKYFAEWPAALDRERPLLMSSFGALVQYLRTLQIERELLTLQNISWYDPIRKANTLVLDGKTLINLEIFANNIDGGSEGTLMALLNRCITPFGKRLFKQWVCHPLMDPVKINARLDAVDFLNSDSTLRDQFTSQLSKLPDLERMISRIHAGSCKPADFVRVLEGFEQIDYTTGLLQARRSSGLIHELIQNMPPMKNILMAWKEAFDHEKAKQDGLLIPEPGVELDFDSSQALIANIKSDLDDLLQRTRKQLGSSTICFRDNGKEIYQLEVPVKVKGVPKIWDQMSATQQVKRYYHDELRGLIRSLQEAQERHATIVKDVSSRFFARFDEHYTVWLAAVRVVSHLDCLVSLAKASTSLGMPCCRPNFVPPVGARNVIDFSELRHPCMETDFIPNDISLGGASANINLLTGANAAGKSTILRMTCIAVIMAQIGCYVPAAMASLTPVDRIMSRLGANDNIFAAQSTFFVELSETKKILAEATPQSLVILDELGRGTSSYDGLAVAESVLHHIASHIGCIGFFATHYHSLAAEFDSHPEIQNKRMAIKVDNDARRVTFLYRLEDGVAEGSFGMHCASMCGISSTIVQRAEEAAKEWEHTSKLQASLGEKDDVSWIPLGFASDLAALLIADAQPDVLSLDIFRRAIVE